MNDALQEDCIEFKVATWTIIQIEFFLTHSNALFSVSAIIAWEKPGKSFEKVFFRRSIRSSDIDSYEWHLLRFFIPEAFNKSSNKTWWKVKFSILSYFFRIQPSQLKHARLLKLTVGSQEWVFQNLFWCWKPQMYGLVHGHSKFPQTRFDVGLKISFFFTVLQKSMIRLAQPFHPRWVN